MPVLLLAVVFLTFSCAKDYRLLKDYYPSTTDAPKMVKVVPTFPMAPEEGAVKDVLTLKLNISNNGNKDVVIDPSKIYISVRTAMHAAIDWEVVNPMSPKVNLGNHALKAMTLKPGNSASGTIYFPKAVAADIEADGLFTLNVDAGYGKKIIIVYKK